MIDPIGAPFDPELHEAVQRVEDPEYAPGTVVAVLAKGYILGGRLLRPAMVAVAVEPVKPVGNESATAGRRRSREGAAREQDHRNRSRDHQLLRSGRRCHQTGRDSESRGCQNDTVGCGLYRER